MADPDPQDSVASFLASISQDLQSGDDEQWTVERIAQRAVEVVPAAQWCGVTLRRRRGRLETVAASDEIAVRCDELQYALGEGPCMDSALNDRPHRIRDMRSDERWPRWSAAVDELGIRSLVSVQLSSSTMTGSHEPLGAINLYSGVLDAFSEDDLDLALVYATHAANALAAARTIDGLQTAVHTRHLIGVAQGILIQRYSMSMDQAFETLQRYSSTTNTKLHDLAGAVIANRALPAAGAGAGAGTPADLEPS